MNFLSKTITSRFFLNEEGYTALVARWREYANDKELRDTLTADVHLAYAVLRGKDYRRSFTPIRNEVKLANGQTPNQALHSALWRVQQGHALKHSVFEGLLSPTAAAAVKGLLNVNSEDAYNEYVVKNLEVAA